MTGDKWQVLRRMAYCGAIVIVVVALAGLGGAAPGMAQDAPPITYERYDVAIAVQPDGSFIVRETQQIRFDGQFSQGFAEIPLDYTTRVDAVTVYEGDMALERNGSGPGSFTTEYDGSALYVDWTFTPTQPGDVRTFVVEYTVVGGLWIYPDQDLLEWRAVPAERSGIPVLASVVTVTLPPDPATGLPVPAGALSTASFGQPASVATGDGQTVFTSDGPIPDGLALQVQVGFPHGIVAAEPQAWQVAEDNADLVYRYLALDTDFAINADGTIDVEERQQLVVEAGALRQGLHTITHTGMDDVVDVAVFEGEQAFTLTDEWCDYCYSVSQTPRQPGWISYDPYYETVVTDETQAGATHLLWTAPALVKGEEATYRILYTLINPLHLSNDAQTFSWTIIFDEQEMPVQSATVRLTLPPGVAPADVEVTGGAVRPQPDGTLLLTPPEPILSTAPWEWSITLPRNATAAVPSQWQQDMEAAQQEAQLAAARRVRAQVLFGGLALLTLLGGLLSLLLLWYRYGRDEPAPLLAEYIPEPPSDLAPGLVAYLLDEKSSIDGALASLFHLATWGLLRIQLAREIVVSRIWNGKLSAGQVIETPDGRSQTLPGHLATLFNSLLPLIDTGHSKTLDQIAGALRAVLPKVYEQMGEEVAPLFDVLPDRARGRWRALGVGLVLLSLFALFFGCVAVASFGAVALAPGLALLAVGLAWMLASRWMPRRKPEGAVEAAKWRAFRRYLLNLEDYAGVAAAQEILDRHFAYAVALDVSEVVLRDAERLSAQMPAWTRPLVTSSTFDDAPSTDQVSSDRTWQATPESANPAPSASTSVSAPPSGRPADQSLSGKSRQMGASLSLASLSLSRTLSAAAGDGGSTMDAMNRAVRSSSGRSATRYSGSSSRSSFSSSSRSSSRSSSGSRSSSSRSSGGGGRRGFK